MRNGLFVRRFLDQRWQNSTPAGNPQRTPGASNLVAGPDANPSALAASGSVESTSADEAAQINGILGSLLCMACGILDGPHGNVCPEAGLRAGNGQCERRGDDDGGNGTAVHGLILWLMASAIVAGRKPKVPD
jgi:hypothetical protein